MFAPAPAPAPEAEKPKPGFWARNKAFFARAAKLCVLAAVGGGAYVAYASYERRQPYEWSGSVEMQVVSVGSRVGGRVQKVLVREGQQVKPGDILVVLEAGELGGKRAIAQADVDAAQAAADKLSNGARAEEVAQGIARLNVSRATLNQWVGHTEHMSGELKRTENLFNQKAASAFERDSALGEVKSGRGNIAIAAAAVREQEAALKLLTSGTRPEEFRAARAQLEVAKAKLALADAELEELNIRAPAKSRVEAITVRPGDILRPDAKAMSLLENGQLYVRIYVPETRLAKLAVGQEVPLSVDSFPKRTFRGRVEHINGIGEFTPRRLITTEERADEVFAARIALLEGESELKAGMAAFIHVPK
jgi:multidrug resistance efflux pump